MYARENRNLTTEVLDAFESFGSLTEWTAERYCGGEKEGDSPAPGPRGQRSVAPRTLNLLVTYCSKTGNQGLNDSDGASAKR